MSSGRVSRHARIRMIAAVATVCALSAAPPAPQAVAADTASYSETYRPQFHFTPEKNWMNDPNGLVYHEGEYHLFYQYNPNGNSWGDMSWGHAVSKDLVHWEELPLALSHDDEEMVFSGSAVVDRDNTTGFGTENNPAMVAIYTSHAKDTGIQAQSLAYSTDLGRTWTKYQGNPVLDIGSKEFRDPKVQWYAPTESWLMTVSLSTEHKVRFYSSKNLKDWDLLSEFGPAGATGGVWECPDLFPLAVDGDENNIKWVLVVNINPGGIAGGSAAQYFVGDFDGEKFTADDKGTYTPPTGTVVQDFEGTDFGTWTTTGTAFGDGPAAGAVDGQGTVEGFDGRGLANSFHSGDGSTGTLTSPEFTIDKRHINFLIGGGNHPTGSADPTAMELVVDGEVVRSTTGKDGEALDWASWDVGDLAGKQARIRIVDLNNAGWGHLLADQFTEAGAAAKSVVQRADWADYGKDYYAAVSWENSPDGKRYMVGWMNNWDYSGAIPTSPWRGAQSAPREMALRTVDGQIRLTSKPVDGLESLRKKRPATAAGVTVKSTTKTLIGPAAEGKALDIEATFSLKDADRFGLKVRTGAGGEETVIGYDATTQELYVDRTNSGAVDFNSTFPGIQTAPLKARNGKVELRILVDWSSVEVFGGSGEAVITDQIFPDPASQGVQVFAENGSVKLDKAVVWHLDSAHD